MPRPDRITGKTTSLMEEAVDLLATLPEDVKVFITGGHSNWLLRLKREFELSGLVGVEFYTPHQIATGCLFGRKGVLLIYDPIDIPHKEFKIIIEEQLRLGKTCG